MLKKDVKNNPNVIIRHVKEAVFEFDKPTAFTLDGEFGGDMLKATISSKKHAVRMMLDHELENE